MKFTEGAFRDWGYGAAERIFGDKVYTWAQYERTKKEKGEPVANDEQQAAIKAGRLLIKDAIADITLQQVLTRPEDFDIIATLNLNGDYLSDALAAQVGGIGIAPGGNINYVSGHAIFEATHGTAPKYANQDKVNPGSVILSGEMMLRYIGWTEAADLILKGLEAAIAAKTVTYDFARLMEGAKEVKCSEFGDAMIAKMEKELGHKLDNNEISHAVHRTRSRKMKGITTEQVRARQLAQLSPPELAALAAVKDAAGGMARASDEPVSEAKALEHAQAHVFERASVVAREEILREALAHARGHLDLLRLKEKVLAAQSLVRVGKGFSTREILETELFLIDSMNGGKDAAMPLARDFEFSAKLGKDQRDAIALILKSPDRFTGIRGLAGTGKSTALSELARALDANGYEKIFCAPTGSATDRSGTVATPVN